MFDPLLNAILAIIANESLLHSSLLQGNRYFMKHHDLFLLLTVPCALPDFLYKKAIAYYRKRKEPV